MNTPIDSRSPRLLRAANAAYGFMALLVAAYAALTALLMHHGAMPPLLFALLFAAVLALLLLCARRTERLAFALPAQPDAYRPASFWGAALPCALVMGVYLLAYFPGGFSSDTLYQWRQIHGGAVLTDWHPALHTLMLGALSAVVDHPAFAIAVQNIAYASAVGYASSVLARWRIPLALRTFIVAYLCLNPAIGNILTFPWKDCAFAICALILAVQLLEAHFSRGAWLAPWSHRLALGVTLCLCSILRHNGVAMTLAAGTWLLICMPRRIRQSLGALLTAVLLTLFIRGPVYDALGVERQKSQLDEIFGVPMTILANIYDQKPESLDEDIVTFLEDVAPRSVYVEHNSVGDWNDIKWYAGSIYFDKPYTLPQVYGFALRAAIREPALALEALGYLWQMPMWPFCDAYWRISPYVDPSAPGEFGIREADTSLLSRALNALNRLSAEPCFAWLTWNPGFLLLLVMASCVLFARRRPLSALLLPAMLICYNLATSAVLSSSTDFRFFLSTPMIAPLCLIGLWAAPYASSSSHADAPRE